ncbi:hypothetical protein IGI04_008663 [Brassica rapa subsp. trilocularis]|uniref:14-3-3 domain-containing protein n=1 Tax=Brassica rapa subsp. trilocularis TaxID=1813537 RepID=A0ABQ7NNC4_BRACM|nr:hypothetical protein IGI04_008663 [Brassica rapa subsp. trilocularis]
MDDESYILHMHMAHLPLRLWLHRCVSKLSLLDESPKRHENLTEGVNLIPVSFMSQFHRSRPDCNLCASWVRFYLYKRMNALITLCFHGHMFLQTKKYCVLLYIKEKILKKLSKQQLDPLYDLDQALRFACVDRGQTENSCCSQTENICCVKCPFCRRGGDGVSNVVKFTEESKIRYAWSKYAELERSLAETELARTIFELAISQYEEYIDYLYPEESQTTNLKILEAAYKWKKQKLAASEEDYDYYQVSFELYQNCELIFFGLC